MAKHARRRINSKKMSVSLSAVRRTCTIVVMMSEYLHCMQIHKTCIICTHNIMSDSYWLIYQYWFYLYDLLGLQVVRAVIVTLCVAQIYSMTPVIRYIHVKKIEMWS